MKKVFACFAIFAALLFVVSCGGSSKKDNKTDSPDTEEKAADEETADTDSTDTGEPADETGSTDNDEPAGDTGSTDNDSGDKTDSEDDADTAHDDADTTPLPDNDADTVEPPVPDDDDDADTADTIPDDDADTADTMPDDDADSDEPGLTDKGIYLGIIGFNLNLFVKEIGLLDNSTLSSYNTFIDELQVFGSDNILYYADYTALGMMRDSLIPPNLKNVFLITLVPLNPDTKSLVNYNYNPENYASNEEYLDALHGMIINEQIHGKKLEAYTIARDSSNSDVRENMKKLSSCDGSYENCNYIMIHSDFNERLSNLRKIAKDIYSVAEKTIGLDVLISGEYEDGQHLRFIFDTYSDSNFYIEATYRRTSGRTLENITYHGLTGSTITSAGSPDGNNQHFVFEDLKYEDGKTPLSNTDISRVMLWKETTTGSWEKESQFEHIKIEGNKQSTLIMLLLDCSSGYIEKDSEWKGLLDILVNGSDIDTAKEECLTAGGSWNGEVCYKYTQCSEKPEYTFWNTAETIRQTWNGSSWQPEAISVYNETSDNKSCRFKCQSGRVWDGSECVTSNACYPDNPCDSIANSTGECTEQKIYDEYYGYLIETVYICGCQQGYLWNEDDLQCRQIPTTFSECNTADTTLLSFPCQDSTTYIWSELYKKMTWQQAKDHCNSLNALNYGGFSSGWHLPTVNELRTLIKNCDGTVTGGVCGVTDSCLSPSCGNFDNCSCTQSPTPKYSKFKDKVIFWSSLAVSTDADYAWFVDFSQGQVSNMEKSVPAQFRCVRK